MKMEDEELTEEQFRALLKIRGGCGCSHMSMPPCSACTDPITKEELEILMGFVPAESSSKTHACEKVNVGFNSTVWACKHCGRDM
jgi:hypothetical protein